MQRGKVQTVLGQINVDDLGIVLPHEHLFIDIRNYFVEPDDPDAREVAHQPISLQNLSWVRSHKVSSLDNLLLADEEMAISEAMHFKGAGGNTIVDVTPNNAGRNPLGLVRVAKATGLNVIMGTAYYVESSYRPELNMDSRAIEDIAEEFVQDIVAGVGDSGVRAGIIGEIGCSWPLTNNERKVLHAAAIAQQRTGLAVSVHPGYHECAPSEIVSVLTEAGADPTHIIISHMSPIIDSHNNRCKLAEMGCYLEWDLFGTDGFYPLEMSPDVYRPSDAERIRQIIQLIAAGYLSRILVSQDVCHKHLLYHFGGMGYSHILDNVLTLMKQKGITEEQIKAIIVENPKRVLSST